MIEDKKEPLVKDVHFRVTLADYSKMRNRLFKLQHVPHEWLGDQLRDTYRIALKQLEGSITSDVVHDLRLAVDRALNSTSGVTQKKTQKSELKATKPNIYISLEPDIQNNSGLGEPSSDDEEIFDASVPHSFFLKHNWHRIDQTNGHVHNDGFSEEDEGF
jgi:hypothetical protein